MSDSVVVTWRTVCRRRPISQPEPFRARPQPGGLRSSVFLACPFACTSRSLPGGTCVRPRRDGLEHGRCSTSPPGECESCASIRQLLAAPRSWTRTHEDCAIAASSHFFEVVVTLPGRRSYQVRARQARTMTAAQVSAALAPFYFAVHPDLFAKYPRERVSAEVSSRTWLRSPLTSTRAVFVHSSLTRTR